MVFFAVAVRRKIPVTLRCLQGTAEPVPVKISSSLEEEGGGDGGIDGEDDRAKGVDAVVVTGHVRPSLFPHNHICAIDSLG